MDLYIALISCNLLNSLLVLVAFHKFHSIFKVDDHFIYE